MCVQADLYTSKIAFILSKRCNQYNIIDLTLTFSTYSCLTRYCDEVPTEENAIVSIYMDDDDSYNCLKKILSTPSMINNISYLFIKESDKHKIPDLSRWFKVVILDQNITVLPLYIKCAELTQELQYKIKKIKRREIKRYIRRRISEETKIDIQKPFKTLTTVRKTILRKELERYGKLEDVLKMLAQDDN